MGGRTLQHMGQGLECLNDESNERGGLVAWVLSVNVDDSRAKC